MLLPAEAGLAVLWASHNPLLRRFALLDGSATLPELLNTLDANPALSTLAGAAWVGLQLAVLVLGSCVGCCSPGPPQRKYPW